jgi:hypothetical protein
MILLIAIKFTNRQDLLRYKTRFDRKSYSKNQKYVQILAAEKTSLDPGWVLS